MNSLVESWILDSGASFHSYPSKELFQNFKSGNFGKVYLADNKALEIEGKGDVCIKDPLGKSVDIGGCQINSWDQEKSDLCWSDG